MGRPLRMLALELECSAWPPMAHEIPGPRPHLVGHQICLESPSVNLDNTCCSTSSTGPRPGGWQGNGGPSQENGRRWAWLSMQCEAVSADCAPCLAAQVGLGGTGWGHCQAGPTLHRWNSSSSRPERGFVQAWKPQRVAAMHVLLHSLAALEFLPLPKQLKSAGCGVPYGLQRNE